MDHIDGDEQGDNRPVKLREDGHHALGALIACIRQHLHADAVAKGQRRLRTGEEAARQDQKNQQ